MQVAIAGMQRLVPHTIAIEKTLREWKQTVIIQMDGKPGFLSAKVDLNPLTNI